MATRLAGLEHEVMVGTHDPEETVSRTEPDAYGHPPFSAWQEEHPEVRLGTFSEAAAHGEMVVNVRSGGRAQPERQDTHRPRQPFGLLKGHAAFALGSNTDSPGEQIQRRFLEAKVVKTLHTMNAYLMVDPAQLAGADHTVFVSGNDSEAKATDTDLLRSFGWTDIIDLGDITTARGTEILLPLWLRLFGALLKPAFNFKIVR
jgi:predicted dinucleotide-binding enzyme